MLIGYARVSKSDGSQVLDSQRDALIAAGVSPDQIYSDCASGRESLRPGMALCLSALRKGDTLVIWKLDRLGRDLKHLLATIDSLTDRGVYFKVLSGAPIDTSSPSGALITAIFAAFAAFERDLISERTKAGLAAAKARGRVGGGQTKMTKTKLARLQAAMKCRWQSVEALADELGVSRQTVYRYVDADGNLREYGKRLFNGKLSGSQ